MISWLTLSCCNWEWVQVFRPIKYSKKYISWWLVFFYDQMKWTGSLGFLQFCTLNLKRSLQLLQIPPKHQLASNQKKGFSLILKMGSELSRRTVPTNLHLLQTTYETWVDVASVVQFFEFVNNLRFWIFWKLSKNQQVSWKNLQKELVVWVHSS